MTFIIALGKALDRFWYMPAPKERIALLRIVIGTFSLVYVCVCVPILTSPVRFAASQFDPVGPVSLLREPLPAWSVYVLVGATLALAVCFLLGLSYRITGPLFAALLLWITSYRSSWGMKFHTENLLVLHVLLLAVAPAADALSFDQRRSAVRIPDEPHGRYGWALRAMSVVTVVTYVLAGIAKLRACGWHWAGGEILRQHIAYDNLRKIELGSFHSPLGVWLVSIGFVFPPLGWLTLLFELGAPLALLGRKVALWWSVAVWTFHVGVALTMAIVFPYPLTFVAYLSFFRIEQFPYFQRFLRRRDESTSLPAHG